MQELGVAAVLLLDWPNQPPGLVQVCVIFPTLFGFKPLSPSVAASAAVELPVSTGAVPRQADEQGAVRRLVAEAVSGPKRLIGVDDFNEVGSDGIQVSERGWLGPGGGRQNKTQRCVCVRGPGKRALG